MDKPRNKWRDGIPPAKKTPAKKPKSGNKWEHYDSRPKKSGNAKPPK